MNGISVILPAYQEEDNLRKILPVLNECLREIEHEILVVDTEEPMDQTKQVCDKNGCIYLPRKGGNSYGDAIRTGFTYTKMPYTVIMDADGSHNPKDILRFYKEMQTGDYDLIIGSRYCKGGNTANSFILKAMSRILNWSYKLLFHLKAKDVSDSFRMYKTKHIKSLNLECHNFDIVEEILILLDVYIPNFCVKEVPIFFNKRDAGCSKRNLIKFIFSYISTMNTLLKIKHRAGRKQK